MKITLYGSPMCSRCKTAKMMLARRNIDYEYIKVNNQDEFIVNDITPHDLPVLMLDDKIFTSKEALMKIRELK